MMEFAGEMGKSMAESKLSELAKEVPAAKLDFKELDKPLQFDAAEISNSNLNETAVENLNQEKKGLTDDEKNQIKEETGWSDEVIDAIGTMDQYQIYKDAGVKEMEINGRKVLVKDIDLDYIDEKTGMSNRERMEKGLSPIDAKTGEKIELHHMGQSYDSPLAELSENSEHGGKNHSVLHDNSTESWRRDPVLKNQYQNHDKPNHWKERASEGGQE